jgi:membrane protease YdiL (CAAX protease family)
MKLKRISNLTNKIIVLLLSFITCMLWAYIWDIVVNYMGYPYEISEEYETIQHSIFYSLIFAPVWEELAFRYAPLEIAKIIGEKAVLPTMVGMSCFFGWIHYGNPESVLLQGVIGFILSYVYLRNGLFWSMLLHAMYNIAVSL